MEIVGNVCKIRLTSKFGEISPVRDYRPHTGIDLALEKGTELRSVVEGVVERINNGGALGKGVIIRGDDGNAYIYGHMSDISVKAGEKIEAGSFIGLSGNTGNSTAPHLHFGVQKPDGEFVDPEPLADTLADLTGDNVMNSGVFTGAGDWLSAKLSAFDSLVSGLVPSIPDAEQVAAKLSLAGLLKAGKVVYVLSDGIALIVVLGSLLIGMAGSKKAFKVTYWSLSTYLTIKVLGVAFL